MTRMFWTQKKDIGPSGREVHRMTYDSNRQRVVLFGGRAGPTVVFNGYLGMGWGILDADERPRPTSPKRPHFGFRQHSATHRLLWGIIKYFRSESVFGDTWEWDGQDWTQMADTGPAARSFHAMAYDSDRSQTVLFGGQVSGGFLHDTWEWDGTEWTQVADTGPSPRDACGATYDTSRQRVVLFGGETISQGMVSQVGRNLGIWRGGVWTQMATTGPGPIVGGACNNGTLTLLFNPKDGSTWTWDGKHWTERQDIGPGSRVGVAMTFDSQRKRAVLFGGGQGEVLRQDSGSCSNWHEHNGGSYDRTADSAVHDNAASERSAL
jgi:hypothetical protein